MQLTTLSGQPVAQMAFSREDFKNKVEEKLRGAILEYFKAETALANGLSKWVDHWHSEAQMLLDELEKVILPHSIRGFRDRKKAFREVLETVRHHDEFYRESARRIVARDFKLKKLPEPLPEHACEEFFRLVEKLSIPS